MHSSAASRALAGTALLSFAAFLFALFSQHVLGMMPCAWCILQRMICLAIALVCLLGWAARARPAALRTAAALALALAVGGVVAAWYQHTVAANLFSCDRTFADVVVTGSGLDALAPSVFGIYATCADSATTLLGVRYELWTLALFVVLAVMSVLALVRRRAPAASTH